MPGNIRLQQDDHLIRQALNQMEKEQGREERLQNTISLIYELVAGFINAAPPSQRMTQAECNMVALRSLAMYQALRARNQGVPWDTVQKSLTAADRVGEMMEAAPAEEGRESIIKKPFSNGLIMTNLKG